MTSTTLRKKLFPSQLDNETIFLVVREHWVHLLLKIIVWAFFAAALPLFSYLAHAYTPAIFDGRSGHAFSLITQIYTLFLALSLLLIWVFYYLNIQIITDIRIVDIDQVGLFSHVVSELHIDKIEDVTSETDGILGTIFNYGYVYVQTAGTIERFEFQNVPHPASIEKLILDLYEKNSNFAKDTGNNAAQRQLP
ncbi:MAG: PH domain-containing protein [Patescibacteria group bacterium]|nr:PH domain-containing protein [Patescibacteria group bacterium]